MLRIPIPQPGAPAAEDRGQRKDTSGKEEGAIELFLSFFLSVSRCLSRWPTGFHLHRRAARTFGQ